MKKLTAALLAAVMALSVASCGTTDQTAAEPETAEPTAPVFEDGIAQPVFSYDTMIREVVYVETDVDTDNDGKADLMQVLIQRPAATNEGMKAASIFEARPYNAGCTDAYDYDDYNAAIVNAELTQAESSTTTTKEDWAYTPAQPGELTVHEDAEAGPAGDGGDVWENTDNVTAYDYWLVRGYAVVSSAGLGTLGSDGYSTCGSDEETAAFASVVKWLAGDDTVKAYSDREGGCEVLCDWSNGNVAMTGQSYAGSTAFAVAATGVEGLKTIVPRAGIANWYDYYRSQGTAAGGLYYPGDDCHILADYCMSREFADDFDSIAADYEAYLQEMTAQEDALSGDYNTFWDERNHTDETDSLNCSAFIVHGLNDFNVRTKQFDMMYKAFAEAGMDVELILHQGAHCTPEQLDNLNYNELLGRWYAHYLYEVDNGAQQDAVVRVQSNQDLSWTEYPAWNADTEEIVLNAPEGQSTFTSDLSSTGFDTSLADVDEGWIEYCTDMAYDWEKSVISGESDASVVYTWDMDEDMHISGTPTATISASADTSTGILSAMMVDIAPDGMDAVVLEEYSESVATAVSEEGGLEYGMGLDNLDLLNYALTPVSQKIITRGWMDIQNRTSVYNVDTVQPGTFYDFTIELQPMDYTVAAGHKLALVIYSIDPEVTYWPGTVTNFTVDGSAVSVSIPVL